MPYWILSGLLVITSHLGDRGCVPDAALQFIGHVASAALQKVRRRLLEPA